MACDVEVEAFLTRLAMIEKVSVRHSMEAPGSVTNLALQRAPIARTNSDLIKLLDQVEPGVDHSHLSGGALMAAKKEEETPRGAPQEQAATHQGPAEG